MYMYMHMYVCVCTYMYPVHVPYMFITICTCSYLHMCSYYYSLFASLPFFLYMIIELVSEVKVVSTSLTEEDSSRPSRKNSGELKGHTPLSGCNNDEIM